ncbi:MAG TPA: hypothetical protein HA232_01670, partial [Methanocellales archaeon]|nr:hypothetical protein [Methanocellales archaeon]
MNKNAEIEEEDSIIFEYKSEGIVFSNKTKIAFIMALFASLIITASIAITRGAYNIPIIVVYQLIIEKLNIVSASQTNSILNTIVWNIRAPRI